ncbi:MAG: endopeptidase La, partial [Candidatus Omnitrophica bacterium]|nr:endopeptidase La [Candidatus Omnitrophota bacterium]
KLLAAHRAGIEIIIIPHDNEKDLVDIPKNIMSKLDVRPVRWIDDVLEIALQDMPTPLEDDSASDRKTSTKGKKAGSRVQHH